MKLKNKMIGDPDLDLKSISSHASSLIQGAEGEAGEFWGKKNSHLFD